MEEAEKAQAEVEAIVIVTETPAEEECAPKLTFGPDGAINDPALIRIIEREKPLGPIDVLKLAQFFSKSPTNFFLAEILRVSALTTMLTQPQIRKDMLAIFRLDSTENKDNTEDSSFLDELSEGNKLGSPTNDERKEDTDDQAIRFIALSNLGSDTDAGLVIQSQVVNDEKTLYVVVGVSPKPAKLPLAGLELRKVRKTYTTHSKS